MKGEEMKCPLCKGNGFIYLEENKSPLNIRIKHALINKFGTELVLLVTI